MIVIWNEEKLKSCKIQNTNENSIYCINITLIYQQKHVDVTNNIFNVVITVIIN